MTHFTSLSIIWDSSKAGHWNYLKFHSFTCLVVDATCQLNLSWDCQPEHYHNASSHALGILTTWWLGSKSKHPKVRGGERERERETGRERHSLKERETHTLEESTRCREERVNRERGFCLLVSLD